jgi:hypothetical protein
MVFDAVVTRCSAHEEACCGLTQMFRTYRVVLAGGVEMPRVVPSQVVEYIKRLSPDETNLGRGNAGELSGLVELVDKIPEELLTMGSEAYASLISSKANTEYNPPGKSTRTFLQLFGIQDAF